MTFRRLAPLALSIAITANAATPPAMPEPGLYRVDTVGTIDTGGGTFTQATDGASGDVDTETTGHEGHRATRSFSGDAPDTRCIRPGAPPTAAEWCRPLGDGRAHCPSGVTLAWRRIDARTWEVDLDQTGPVDTQSGGLEYIAGRIAQHGTPEEQAKAREAMRQLPRMREQQAAAMADVHARMQEALRDASPEEAAQIRQMMQAMAQKDTTAGAPPMRVRATQRLTRLGDRCE